MTMGDCLRTNKLIILRGNSGSGKTTIAKELQQVFGNNTMLISQDVIRRDMLKVKDGENTGAFLFGYPFRTDPLSDIRSQA